MTRVKPSGVVTVMDGPVVLFMLFSGLCFLPACFPHKYFLVEIAKPWPEAQDYCRGSHAHLARVETAEELEEVVEVSNRYFGGHVWIGLHHGPSSWTWSLQGEGGPAAAEYRKWSPGEPSDAPQGTENCVFMKDGHWYDAPCWSQLQFVCSNGSAAWPGLVPVDLELNWNQAQSHCREKHTDLAGVSTEAENEQLKKFTADAARWIGLHKAPWKWSDGTSTSFSKWNTAAGEPSHGAETPCVLLHSGHWEDEDCGRRLFFVCQLAPPMTRIKLKVTAGDSSGSLEDAAGAVLKQLDQRVKEAGLRALLTWTKTLDGKIFLRDKEVTEETEDKSCSVTAV